MSNKYNLTPRELEILSLVAKGYSNGEIAQELTISIHTVRTCVVKIYSKLSSINGTTTRTKAALVYLREFAENTGENQ